jgi:sodium/proline symporter
MSDQTLRFIAIAIYFAAMIAIGLYAFRKTDTHEDYMLAGRELKPWVAALSAGASDMSGWLMMGLPGALYLTGLVESWIAIGLTCGAYLNWKIVAPRLRAYTERSRNSITIPSFLENRLRDTSRILRVASGVIILVFFTFYVASMMVAGGVFFQESFGSTYLIGMLLIAGVTLVYTLFGGFLGASLTDVVQGTMMMLALVALPIMAVIAVGGIGETFEEIQRVGPGHLSFLGAEGVSAATLLMIISSLGWGLGYFGQPHIIVRFMAMKSPASARAGRRVGMTWMVVSLGSAVIGGLVGLAYFSKQGITLADSETVMLAMAQALFHPLVAGLVLAAVLAAIMSTVSSQLIVCSSALVEDLLKVVVRKELSKKTLVMLGRMCVLLVAVVAVLLALDPGGTILELVGFAWAGFGASFGPIILLSLFWRKLTNWGALAGMVVGAATVFIWSALDTGLYEIIPGVIANVLVAVVVSRLTYTVDEEIEEEFTDAVAMVKQPSPVG